MKKPYTAIIILLLSISLIVVTATAFYQPPSLIHLSTEGDPSITVTITWKTRSYTQSSTVEYGESTHLNTRITGLIYTYDGAAGVLHKTRLDGLHSNTLYRYRAALHQLHWTDAPILKEHYT